MPANKGPIFVSMQKDKSTCNGGLGACYKKKKQRVGVKSKKHCKQYLSGCDSLLLYPWSSALPATRRDDVIPRTTKFSSSTVHFYH
ncbi:hypothetical protein HCN44_011454 [Aphidius gifuensis]|uniref:Uncharacterized protein n=1 Tax=Aphidius gifuensis TaxID=684658 RepID=A0A834XVH7_APHGI|nr:hypothetical protein HCN44_011454 [Aphidius gifuensis]